MKTVFFLMVYAVPFALALWWASSFMMSRFGWSRLADRFGATQDVPHNTQRFLWQSFAIKSRPLLGPRYNTAINIWVDAQGIWLRPILMLRFAHPLLNLPWTEIVSVERDKILFTDVYKLQLRGDFPPLTFYGPSGKAIYDHWLSRSPSNRPYPDGRNFGV